jgi:hypothetical protein
MGKEVLRSNSKESFQNGKACGAHVRGTAGKIRVDVRLTWIKAWEAWKVGIHVR